MNDNTRCFILVDDGYEEITYAELQERRVNEPAYSETQFIPLHGMLLEVCETDYKTFYRDVERQKYLKKEADRVDEMSYNALDSNEMNGEDIIPDTSSPVIEQVLDKLLVEEMLSCFGKLDETDRNLIAALYFENRGERTLADELGITHQAVNKRRQKVIAKLRELMGF